MTGTPPAAPARRFRVLVVDDEDETRSVLRRALARFGHDVETAMDGIAALAKIKLGVDLVLLDATMPGMDGFTVARRIRADPESADRMVLTTRAGRRRAGVRVFFMGDEWTWIPGSVSLARAVGNSGIP